MNPSAPSVSSHPSEGRGQTYRGPFAIMTILFFMWGFMTVWNDLLIPNFKEAFKLSTFEAMLVQFAFFGAYGVGSFIYFMISMTSGDPINRIGYKNGVIIGLLTSAVGTAAFYPAAQFESFHLFLAALFIVGLGFAMLQIAANPYVTILGPERTASSRLNLSQAFNSFGTTIGPIIGGWLIFELFKSADSHGANAVKIPYLCAAGIFVLLAILFKFSHLPAFTNTEEVPRGAGALRHPHTALGMLAIFMYVGGEVAVGSSIILLLKQPSLGGLPDQLASSYLSYFWGGLMIGRFMGAFALSDLRSSIKNVMIVAVPVIAFLVIWLVPHMINPATRLGGLSHALHYGGPLLVLLLAFFVASATPQRLLATCSGIIIALLAVGILGHGAIAMWAILGVGLFCSVMWSNIFSLAIEGLGPLKSQASSLLVMAILGGAILPPIQGALADKLGIQMSFIVPMIAFAYIGFYGIYGYRAGRKPTAS